MTDEKELIAALREEPGDSEEVKEFKKLLEKNAAKLPKVGDTVTGVVIAASNSEVRLDIDGVMTGVIRGRELYPEAEEYSTLKPGDTTEATVIEEENENGELELSFRFAGQEKAWRTLREAHEKKTILGVKVLMANKGGLLATYRQINGFLPVSQLSPENYPRVEGGDKSKILDKLRKFVGTEMPVKVITLDEKEDKIIFSEKEAWVERQRDIISKYKVGTMVEGEVTAVTDFGVFIKFGENLEGLVHISELAWQRIDNPSALYKIGDTLKAEIIQMDGSKVFLSAKRLQHDPWQEVEKKFAIGQTVRGKILKVNPFGLFVGLDVDIHGLAHINSLSIEEGKKISEMFKEGEEFDFVIISLDAKEHRLGLSIKGMEAEKAEIKEEKVEAEEAKEKKDMKEKKEKKEKKKAEEKDKAEEKPKKIVKKKIKKEE
jgi:small subunit ribosomal protein S1